jgi:hypothetical protein
MNDIVKDFDHALATAIREDVRYEDGTIYNVRTQDVDGIIDYARHAADQHSRPYYGDAAWRYVGTIPLMLAEAWSKETGIRIGTREFADLCKTRLMDSSYAYLRVKGV